MPYEHNAFFISISAVAFLAALIAVIGYFKNKKSQEEIQILKNDILQLQEQIDHLERKMIADRSQTEDSSLVDHFSLLQSDPADSNWKKNTKNLFKKAFHNPGVTVTIATTIFEVVKKIRK